MIDLFFCSKPLQIFNARNIPELSNGNIKCLLIFSQFYNGRDFASRVKKFDPKWGQVICRDSVFGAYCYMLFHRIENVYTGYDNGTMFALICRIKKINVFYFEEGAGMYFDQLYIKPKWKQIIDKIIGVSPYTGHSSFIKAAYVYLPEVYKKRKIVNYPVYSFKLDYVSAVRESSSIFCKFSDIPNQECIDVYGKKILLFVTDKIIYGNVLSKIREEVNNYDLIVVKPHPHIVDVPNIGSDRVILLKTNIMIEFIIDMWLRNKNVITMYHCATSTVLYYKKYIRAIDFAKNDHLEYSNFIEETNM